MRKGKKLLIGNLWKYIFVALASVFIWSAVFESIGQIKDYERLTIGVYNLDCDTVALKTVLGNTLPELTQQEILELYVDDLEHTPHQTYAADVLAAQLLQSDFVIMPQSLLEQLDIPFFFSPLPEALCKQSGQNYYESADKTYGLQIGEKSVFWQYCETGEPCYLLLCANSVNLGGIYDRGELTNDAGLCVLEFLLKEDAS